MSSPSTSTAGLSHRFALILQGLCDAVAVRSARHRNLTPLLVLVWSRLRRTIARFHCLAARTQAGRCNATPRPRVARPAAARPPSPFPRGHAWLIRLVPEAAAYGSQLQHMLAHDPDLRALLAAAPQVGRILRPLCRMLGVTPEPAILAKPARAVAPRTSALDPEPPAPTLADLPALPPTPA